MRRWRILPRALSDSSGAAALEFAIISVPLVVLIIGLVDLGRALYARNNMAHASDVGARLMLIDSAVANANVTTEIRNAFVAGSAADLTVGLGTATVNGIDFRTIDLAYDIDLLTPLLAVSEVRLTHSRRVPVD